MRKLFVSLVILMLAATACASKQTSPAPVQNLGPTPTYRVVMQASDPAAVVLAADRPQLIEFFAYWCRICQRAAPAIHKVEQSYSGRVGFVFLDTDDPATDEFKRSLGYAGLPTFVLLDGDGNILKRWAGSVSEQTLIQAFDAALAGNPVP